MAAAARPGPSDARVPCPQCGGLIHPIAGRCKHCKADLAAFRSARPAAAAALPALAPVPQQHLLPAPQPPAPVAAPVSTPLVVALHAPRLDESQPILPPRPTGRMQRAEPRSAWKQWPVIVIVLAMLAIAAAVVLMVWPTGAKDDPKTTPPPPAPERMDTNPLGPQGALPPAQQPAPPAPSPDDPWSSHGGGGPSPTPAPNPNANPNIDPPDPLNDPFGPSNGAAQLSMTILQHACARVMSCGNADPMFRATCDGFTKLLPAAPTPTCAAAQRCITRLDALDCDTALDLTNPASVMNDIKDCLDAAWSC